jgi:hypothetical protein
MSTSLGQTNLVGTGDLTMSKGIQESEALVSAVTINSSHLLAQSGHVSASGDAQGQRQSVLLIAGLAFLVLLLIAGLFLLFFCSRRRTESIPDSTSSIYGMPPPDFDPNIGSDTELISQERTDTEVSFDDLEE